ncbi:gastrin/cholecystokinin type B receptor isoform X2 [Aplysia californica]|uniref:Gastrin/cholecystokinin type B receptor isoform X2 n=1 Tax=Aplysia californica TaxID=6500 RepID=A0ABM0JXA8_APLCA|nr:gastrin/cholecystokinin type B receptor isoform X2 [Aplysia californica]
MTRAKAQPARLVKRQTEFKFNRGSTTTRGKESGRETRRTWMSKVHRISQTLVVDAHPTAMISQLLTNGPSSPLPRPAAPNISNDITGYEYESLDEYLAELSDARALTLLPAILVLGVIMVCGAVGNSLVFYIYLLKFHPSSTRSAILALAGLDLLTCAVSIPGEILDLRYAYSFSSDTLCKGFRLATTMTLIASGFILLVVAVDRYHRICRPMRNQLTAADAWRRVLFACLLAIAFSVPAPVVYGVARVATPLPPSHNESFYGSECSTSQQYQGHALPIAYNVVLCLLFLAAFLTMIVLYALIGRQVLRQMQFRSSMKNRRGSMIRTELGSNGGGNTTARQAGTAYGEEAEHSISDGAKDSSLLQHEIKAEPDLPSSISAGGHSLPGSPTSVTSAPRLSRKSSVLGRFRRRTQSGDARTRKTTLMLFFITIVFVASFLPHLLLKVMQALNKTFVENLSMAGLILYNIFVRSCFFNTAVNSFVYGFCSPKFRQECKALFIVKLAFWVKRRKMSVHSDDLA